MSKRRRASELMFKKKFALKYPVQVVAALTGTGTIAHPGIITLVASNVSTRAYITVATATNLGVLVGTAVATDK